jgi:hypothetical protein
MSRIHRSAFPWKMQHTTHVQAVGAEGAGFVWQPPMDSVDFKRHLLTPPNP